MYTCIVYLLLGTSLAFSPGCALDHGMLVAEDTPYYEDQSEESPSYEYEDQHNKRVVTYRPVYVQPGNSFPTYSWRVRFGDLSHTRGAYTRGYYIHRSWVENRRRRRAIRRHIRSQRYGHHFKMKRRANKYKKHKKYRKKRK